MTHRRPRWRSYLLLARVSNVPTVWTNVLAGTAAAGAAVTGPTVLPIAAAASLFYVAGMFLNDAFDAGIDAHERPERPIPAGDVSRAEAFVVGGALLAAALLALAAAPAALPWGLVLAAAIVMYDFRHKGDSFAPFVMGACRGLVYCLAAAAAAHVTQPVMLAAAVMTAYVVSLTVIARRAGRKARWLVPLLIAGISILDAGVIALTGNLVVATVAALGFPLTLLLQRVVPGD